MVSSHYVLAALTTSGDCITCFFDKITYRVSDAIQISDRLCFNRKIQQPLFRPIFGVDLCGVTMTFQ